MGTVVLGSSLRDLSLSAQTEITREAIAMVVDAGFKRKEKRKLSKDCKKFQFGQVDAHMLDVSLSVSATGLLIAPPSKHQGQGQGKDFDPEADGVINFHPMRLISLASGGEDYDYDMISYVAKDKDTGVRRESAGERRRRKKKEKKRRENEWMKE